MLINATDYKSDYRLLPRVSVMSMKSRLEDNIISSGKLFSFNWFININDNYY